MVVVDKFLCIYWENVQLSKCQSKKTELEYKSKMKGV